MPRLTAERIDQVRRGSTKKFHIPIPLISEQDWLDTVTALEAEIAALRRKKPEGEIITFANLSDLDTYVKERVSLARAAFARKAADNCRVRAISENVMRDMARKRGEASLAQAHSDRASVLEEQQEAILALAESDLPALDEHDQEECAKTMQEMHDDLSRCIEEGKDPVLLMVVWRDTITELRAKREKAASEQGESQ